MGTTFSKLFGNGSKKNNDSAEPGAGQSATLPRPTTSKVKVDVPKKSSSFRLPFPKKSKTPSPAVTPTIPPKNQENVAAPAPITPTLNVIDVQIDEEAFKKTDQITVESVTECVMIVKTELESVAEDVKNENEEDVENAIVKIQAGVRGFLTRKHIKEGSSPDKEFGGAIDVPSFDNEKRIETPTPSSPLKTTFSVLESVLQPEERPEVPLEELEILKKVQEINQLLAKDDDDELFNVVKNDVQTNVQQTTDTITNAVDEGIRDAKVVIESAFADVLQKSQDLVDQSSVDIKQDQQQSDVNVQQSSVQQVPIHVVKSPSIEEEEEEEEKSGLSEEAAAIRIQAAYRGYGVRKSLSREPSPGRDKIDDENKAFDEAQALLEQSQPSDQIVEDVFVKSEAETLTSDNQPFQEPETVKVQEEIIVPVVVPHDPIVSDTILEEPSETDGQILNLDNEEFTKLEALVSDNILSDVVSGVTDVEPEPVSTNLPEPIKEDIITQTIVEHKSQQPPVAQNDAVPEVVPEIVEQKPIENIIQEIHEAVLPEENKEIIEKSQDKVDSSVELPTSPVDEPSFDELSQTENVSKCQETFEPEKFSETEGVAKSEETVKLEEVEKLEELKPEELKPEKSQLEEPKLEELKPEESQSEEPKPEESKPEESQSEEPKPEELKPEESQSEEPKPEELKPEESQSEEPKPEESKPEDVSTSEKVPEPEAIESSNDEQKTSANETTNIVQEKVEEKPSEVRTIDNVIESLDDNKESLVMKIKIGVESKPEEEKKEEDKDGEDSDEDVSTSMPVNRDSSPAASGNKKRNRNRNKNRKR